MSGNVIDLMKKKPNPKVFSSVGVKPAPKKDIVINAKIVDRTGENIVDRTAILRNIKKNTKGKPVEPPPIKSSSDTQITESQELQKPIRRSKPIKFKIKTPAAAFVTDAAGETPAAAFVTDAAGETPAAAATVKVKKNSKKLPKKLPKKLHINDTLTSVTLKPKADTETLEELPPGLIIIDDVPIAKRLPKPEPNIIIPSSHYYMNNRENFINFIDGLFEPYKTELNATNDSISCDSVYGSNEFSLLTHQKIVRDYINLYTPYRGILLYHGLGSGKTCSSIAIAEGMKTKNKIMVMTPASLRVNYIEELKNCGDILYKKTQFWEFISIEENPEYLDTLVQVLSIEKTYIQRNKGAWLVNTQKESNFNILTTDQKLSLDSQLNEMIRSKYEFVSYNGLRRSHLIEFTQNNTINPFTDKVVIIDEVHNFVSRIVNKIKNKESLSVQLYEYMMTAENCRFIMLSGTPIINYPNEIGILFNILRGYIKTWNIQLDIKTATKINVNTIKKIFSDESKINNIIDFIEYKPSSKILVVTKNPFGFINNVKDSVYNGVHIDEHGQLNDGEFIELISKVLSVKKIFVDKSKIDLVMNKALPDTLEPFKNYFIDDNGTLKNVNLFKRRILGLTSYYRSAQEKLMPRYSREKDFKIVKVEISDYQFGVYEKARVEERKLESKNKKKKKTKVDNNMFDEDGASTYRIFSRAFCNFVFPKEINRPIPKDVKNDLQENIKLALSKGLDEDSLDAVQAEEKIENIDGRYEKDDLDAVKSDIKANSDSNYPDQIANALRMLEANTGTYLTEDALETYSPKFLSILKNITNETNIGSHLFYSQFRTIEGVGVFSLVLKENGFSQFKIKKNAEDEWVLDIAEDDMQKPKFVLYTGTETSEEKEIIRKIFNNQWDDIPKYIKETIETIAPNNNIGEIIKVFMITASGAEGISLKNVRFVHLCEPYWHPVRTEQVIGRARRICSHDKLPVELQSVEVFLYLMTFSEKQLQEDKSIELRLHDTGKLDSKIPLTSDEALFEISSIKEDITKQILISVKETAMDCALHYKPGSEEPLACYTFGNAAPDKFSYVPSLNEEENDSVSKINKVKKTFKVSHATIKGVKYVLNKETDELYDFKSYTDSTKDPRIVPRKVGNLIEGRTKIKWV